MYELFVVFAMMTPASSELETRVSTFQFEDVCESSVNVIAASQSSFNNAGSTYVLAKKIQLPSGGVIQVLFDLWRSGGTAYGRIYKNGVAVGTERTTTSTTPVSWTENITFAANDTIELWIKNSGANSTYTQRFELAVNQALTVPVTLK